MLKGFFIKEMIIFTENGQLDQIWKVKILFFEFFKDIKSINIFWDLKSLFSESQQKAPIQLPLIM